MTRRPGNQSGRISSSALSIRPSARGLALSDAGRRARQRATVPPKILEQRFHTLFTDSPVAMSLGDQNGRWVETNDALAAMFGVQPATLDGSSAVDYVHPDDLPGFLAARERHRASGRPLRNYELRFIRADGSGPLGVDQPDHHTGPVRAELDTRRCDRRHRPQDSGDRTARIPGAPRRGRRRRPVRPVR